MSDEIIGDRLAALLAHYDAVAAGFPAGVTVGIDVDRLADALAEYDIRGYATDPHGEWLNADVAAAAIAAAGVTVADDRVVVIDASIWPHPRPTRLPWWVWDEVPIDDHRIYDPDGFRNGAPTIVTWDEFQKARMYCTIVGRFDPSWPGAYEEASDATD